MENETIDKLVYEFDWWAECFGVLSDVARYIGLTELSLAFLNIWLRGMRVTHRREWNEMPKVRS